jgi:hypothetical protein
LTFPEREESVLARRVNSDLLLVGSLPADSTEGALRTASEFFGDLVFALPDGETRVARTADRAPVFPKPAADG